MNKKISIFTLIFTLAFGIQLLQPKKADAFDFDDFSNVASQIWNYTKDDVLVPVVKSLASKMLNKMTESTVNWANGGFDGDPSFINNWDDFLKGTEHELISGAFTAASNAANDIGFNNNIQNDYQLQASYNECLNPIIFNAITAETNAYEACMDDIGDEDFCLEEGSVAYDVIYNAGTQSCQSSVFTSTVGNIAQQNYNLYQSGELNTTRAVATTIATAGSEQLNGDALNSLIVGDGETLTTLLGSQSAKDAFKSDITVGGWEGYLALADPHNYDSGLQNLVKGALSQKTTETVSTTIDNLQTPVKFLDKQSCSDGGTIENGECPDGEKLVTNTPGDQVATSLENALQSENESVQFLSDSIGGALISAIGKLTDGLISSGISQLTSAATSAFFTPSDTNDITNAAIAGGSYQSQYDVLGIVNDPSDTLVSQSTDTGGGSASIFGTDVDTSFIGGPEDLENTAWNNAPQVIINLRESLEYNILLAEEELGYFNEASDLLDNAKNTAISLDRCLPGPDYGWEGRYKDIFDINDNEYDKLGYIETIEMVEDPRVNIPGSERMRNIFEQLLGGTRAERTQVEYRIDQLSALLTNLNYIKQEITSQFTVYKNELNMTELVLTEEKWNNLSATAKQTAGEYANTGFAKADGTQQGGYLTLKPELGETVASVLASDSERVRDAVISMSWGIWRDRTPTEEKNDLRYSFYIQQSNLSNDEFIARAKSNLNKIDSGAVESEKTLSDCLVLKAYALGVPVEEIREITAGSELNITASQQSSVTSSIISTNPFLNPVPGNIAGIFFSSAGSFSFIDIPSPEKTNEEIKEFLMEEFAKKNDADPNTESLFVTNTIASEEAINASILGFDNTLTEIVNIQTTNGTATTLPDYEEQELPQREAYFQSKYPDYGFKSVQRNSYEVTDLYKKDRFYSSFSRARGERGILFCRNPRVSDLQRSRGLSGDDDTDFQPECIRNNWYATTNLEYTTFFSGVSEI